MIITETSKGDIVILSLTGKLDALSARELRTNDSLTDPQKMVVLDLEKVDCIDASGFGTIIGACRKKLDGSGEIVVCCLNERMLLAFEITKMKVILHIVDGMAAAVDYAQTWQRANS